MNNRGGDSKGKFGTPNLNSSNRDGLPSVILNGKNQIGGKEVRKKLIRLLKERIRKKVHHNRRMKSMIVIARMTLRSTLMRKMR
jgi:hypothetical protein